MTPLGERFHRTRVEKNISLERVATDLKIGGRLLEAIESGNFERLPGGLFRKSFVLQYARYLGFDSEAIAAELKHLSAFEGEPEVPWQETPRFGSDMPAITPVRDWSWLSGSVGSLVSVIAVVLACAGLFVLWQRTNELPGTSPNTAATSLPPAPQTLTPATPPEAAAVGPSSSEALATVTPAALGSGTAVRVDLVAGEDTWVQALSDGRRVFSDALRANQSRIIQASDRVRLLVGNAGGIEISYNGKPIGPIGPRGQVRTIEFTPVGFQIVPRKPPTSEPL